MTFVGDVYMALVHWKWGLSEDANECISYKARKDTRLGVQSWVRFCQQEYGECPRPAWAVGSYSSGHQPGELPKSKSTQPSRRPPESPCTIP